MRRPEDGRVSDGKLFHGVEYRLLGFSSESERKYKSFLDNGGAKAVRRYMSGTHLIVSSSSIEYGDPQCVKAFKMGEYLVNELWLEHSLAQGSLADTKKVLYKPVINLNGICGALALHICCIGFTKRKAEELMQMCDFIGATFYEDWTPDKVTHLVCFKFEGETFDLAKKAGINIVTYQWLEQCLGTWRIIPIDNYTMHTTPKRASCSTDTKRYTGRRGLASPRDRRNCDLNYPTKNNKFYTPPNKKFPTDISRNAFSTGGKLASCVEHDKPLKCKRVLEFKSSRSINKLTTLHEYPKDELTHFIKIEAQLEIQELARTGIKVVLQNAYALILDLHIEGKSLKGLFSAKNFVITEETQKVHLQNVELSLYNEVDGQADKDQFVMIVQKLFGEGKVPKEVKIWIDCISDGVEDDVLRSHINMLHPNCTFGMFSSMYHSLVELQSYNAKKYKTFLVMLPMYNQWKHDTFSWKVIEQNKSYIDPRTNQKPQYDRNVFGLLSFLRNCFEHPAKLFQRYLLAFLMRIYPHLLSNVQRALHHLGCLPQLDKKTLRLSWDKEDELM